MRFSDEELKHQALFRRIEAMAGDVLPDGYRFDVDANAVARVVLGKSTWAVLALTLDIELFTQLHYRRSIEPDAELSELFKDVFLYHWREESQHAILDELELARHDAGSPRSNATGRSTSSSSWFPRSTAFCKPRRRRTQPTSRRRAAARSTRPRRSSIEAAFLKAYRWQYIHSGAQHPHFGKVLSGLITEDQGRRIQAALATLQ